MRITLTLVLAGVVASGFSCASALAQQKGGEDVTGPYDVVVIFPSPSPRRDTFGDPRPVFLRKQPTESSWPAAVSSCFRQ